MADKQGQRAQNDPNAAHNQGKQHSNISSEHAQHSGSTEGNRSVQSGVSGIPSQRHEAEDRSTAALNLEDQVNTTMSSGTGQNRPGENQGGANQGTARTDKHGQSRVDNGSGMGSEQDRDGSTGSRRNH